MYLNNIKLNYQVIQKDRGYLLVKIEQNLQNLDTEIIKKEFMKYFDDIKGNITRITSMVYPIQSCNDRILALMNRKYTVKDFFESVKSIRAVHPNIYLINNIIY